MSILLTIVSGDLVYEAASGKQKRFRTRQPTYDSAVFLLPIGQWCIFSARFFFCGIGALEKVKMTLRCKELCIDDVCLSADELRRYKTLLSNVNKGELSLSDRWSVTWDDSAFHVRDKKSTGAKELRFPAGKMVSLENEGVCLSNNNSVVRLSDRWQLDFDDSYFHIRDIKSTTESRFRFWRGLRLELDKNGAVVSV